MAQTEAQELRRKLADITNQEDEEALDPEVPPTKRTRTNSELEDPETKNEEIQAINAGHQFVMLYSPWLRSPEETFRAEYIQDFNEAERFENNENKVQAQLREIMKILGSQLSSEISSETWISKAVRYSSISLS
jgi:hypothetical protein